MFVGVGASRIRSLFADAKKNAPCIIFIDEIDAIGRQRSGGGGFATNDEREQTLNQILTEMDGFSGNTGVIVIAATNRADILDNALLRPGRFDRRVPVDLPDKAGRAEILKVHIRGKPLAPDVDVETIAGRSIGFSGAQLQNLMNEAAIVAARRSKDVITFDEIDYALDRLTVGMQKTTGTSNADRQKLVAYHEAGHAVMAALTPDYDTVSKVTIIPRTNGAGGFTLFTPSEDRLDSGMYSMKYLKAQLAVALGGRVAEELVFGEENVTTGASNDQQQVLRIARAMVTQFGYSKATLAPVAWETGQENGMSKAPASAAVSSTIDDEVRQLTNDAYAVCKKTIGDNMPLMDKLVERLLESETVDAGEMQQLVFEFSEKSGMAPELADVSA
jgi:cell division protease FtsH